MTGKMLLNCQLSWASATADRLNVNRNAIAAFPIHFSTLPDSINRKQSTWPLAPVHAVHQR
ncbi:MAG: hypothetical protein CBB71_03900 [Rhodopirellula sp. TMED11]|nr:MAG: hypothetical protein CBB71_03900 [Rhodopirellula sp. TMED11]